MVIGKHYSSAVSKKELDAMPEPKSIKDVIPDPDPNHPDYKPPLNEVRG